MAQLVTEVERAAQSRTVEVVRTSSVLTGGGLAMWREYQAGERKASAAELSADLDTLGVPHQIVVAFRPLLVCEVRRRKGQDVRVDFKDLPRLVRWVPSVQQRIDELPSEAPGFTFMYCEPRTTGMALLILSSFAAEWPAWTEKQAAAMGLTCAQCGFDLRTRGAGERVAVNIPDVPKQRRLVCGACRNDGLTELDRPAEGDARGLPQVSDPR